MSGRARDRVTGIIMAHSVQKVVERCEHAQGGEDGDGEGKGHLGKSLEDTL